MSIPRRTRFRQPNQGGSGSYELTTDTISPDSTR